jgi:hypothetical protein
MDVILQTQSTDPSLDFVGVTRFADGSGYVARLRVRSRGFILDRSFYFDGPGLADFVEALGAMDRCLSGTAELRTPYEDHYIRLALGPRGRVAVTGEIREYSGFDQLMRFGFETDQTVLGPFARDLDAIHRLAV